MTPRDLMSCLEARKSTLESSIDKKDNRQQDHSDWAVYSRDELIGRLAEIKNTLDMLKNLD